MTKLTMSQMTVAVMVFLFVPGILLLYFSPDVLTLAFIAVMVLLCAVGTVIALLPLIRYGIGFHEAYQRIEHLRAIQPDELWGALLQSESLFQVPDMDDIFYDYKLTVEKERREQKAEQIDLEDLLSAQYIDLRTWKGVVQQIPNTQTGIGILGTFVGLLAGIGNIGFSSAETVVTSVQSLLSGINIAFYTSIAGVIFSILFNMVYKTILNMARREMELFYREFHTYVRRRAEDVEKEQQHIFQKEILDYLHDMRERELLNL